MHRRGVPLVVSAPSGTGKTTLCRGVMERLDGVEYSISHTTRPPRGQEENGRDYFFVDDAEFDALVKADAFLEWAHVHGCRYGTSRRVVESRLVEGKDLLFDIDVQGGRQIADRLSDARLLFILPPNMTVLEQRLRGRKSDSEEQIQRRLGVARQEIQDAAFYTHWLVNDDLERAIEELRSLLIGERLARTDKRQLIQQFSEESRGGEHA